MTTLQLPTRTAVRAAGLVDVPAVVRLIAPTPPPTSTPDGSELDWERKRSALRLVLAHYALEEGHVRVAERADGALVAVAVWLPPGTDSKPPDTFFTSLLSRELAAGPRCRPVVPTWPQDAEPEVPHWKVVVVGALDDANILDDDVVADLLAPGLRTLDDEAATAVAITVSAAHAEGLRPLGFHGPREADLVPGASVWLTTRHPSDRWTA
ncbi:hypothetical protein ACIP79_26125 [Streptomyces sp. NPDC088747]|uniref:hypothetical protein n=1 Tax=Streptomyces sp. NPDC088747 TaxID=3365886 RepID=UPI003819E665